MTKHRKLWRTKGGSGWQEARAKLIYIHRNLVRHVLGNYTVGRHHPGVVDNDDLMSAGVIGLIQSVDKFEPERGFDFSTYAVPRIWGAMLDEVRSMDWVPRLARERGEPVPAFLSIQEFEFDYFAASAIGPDAEAEVQDELTRRMERVRRAISYLPKRHRMVLEGYYLQGMRQRQFAELWGVSPSRVCQMMKEALAELREAI
jgi:RNA polymerase sigma factor FliA